MEPICRIKEIYKTLYQFERIFSERHGLTINEAMLLCCLRDGRPRTAGTLCDFVGLSNPLRLEGHHGGRGAKVSAPDDQPA